MLIGRLEATEQSGRVLTFLYVFLQKNEINAFVGVINVFVKKNFSRRIKSFFYRTKSLSF